MSADCVSDSRSLEALDHRLRAPAAWFVGYLRTHGLGVRITSTYRSLATQRCLYERFLRGESGGIPAAPPGRSLHHVGLAFDMVVTPPSWQAEVGRAWIRFGGQWFSSDPVHFQAKQYLNLPR